MMGTAPPLLLTREQGRRLQAYLQTYRRYAFALLMPSTERNTTLRVLQGMQGKLVELIDQKTTPLPFVLTGEELVLLKVIIVEVLKLVAQEPNGPERNAALVDLADLKGHLRNY